MALYDNKYWLMSHIKNSFVLTDDTGMCELVMMSDDLPQHLVDTLNTYPDSDESLDDDLEHESYDIQLDSDIIPGPRSGRPRSNTAARLEKMEQARKRAARTRNVKWENSGTNQCDLESIFVKKDLSNRPRTSGKSLLSEQLEKCTNFPQNPYMEYAKFDGSAQMRIPVRKYKIFLTFLPEEQRNYPMIVLCIATAKISDLIGLICLKCSTAYGDCPLQPVDKYGLYITEEDGEVEGGFPCLDPKECIAKFGWTCLALVEHKTTIKNVSFEGTTLSLPFEKVLKKSNSTPTLDETTQQRLMEGYNSAVQAPEYKSYTVTLVSRMRGRADVMLGISFEKVEIDPVRTQKSSRFALVKPRPVSHHIQSVASCHVSEIRTNKCIFRIVYSATYSGNLLSSSEPPVHTTSNFKHYDFETDTLTAREIVQKINHILDLQSSRSQKEYLAIQERKILRRKSFHFK